VSTTIYSLRPGRTIGGYDLLDNIQELTGLPRADAHAAIHATLAQLVDIDGDDIILNTQPVRPKLLRSNPDDRDVDSWITISDDTAAEIREAIITSHETT
jgi:hypothetical protein